MKVIPKVKKQNNTIRGTKNLKEVCSQKLANLQCIYKKHKTKTWAVAELKNWQIHTSEKKDTEKEEKNLHALINFKLKSENKLEKVTLKTSIQIIRFSKNEKVFYVWKKISLKTLRSPFLINNCIWTHQQIRKWTKNTVTNF